MSSLYARRRPGTGPAFPLGGVAPLSYLFCLLEVFGGGAPEAQASGDFSDGYGMFSSAATRSIRFFMVVGFVPSGTMRRVAVVSSDWSLCLRA